MRFSYPHLPQSVAIQPYMSNNLTLLENECIVAPITSQCSGLAQANLTNGIRKVILNRVKGKKYGLRMRAVNQVFSFLLLISTFFFINGKLLC